MRKIFFIFLILFLIFTVSSFAQQEETIELSTYYPAPYGVYNELKAKKMAIGTKIVNGQEQFLRAGAALLQVGGECGREDAIFAQTQSNVFRARAITGYANNPDQRNFGVYGVTNSNVNFSAGVWAEASGDTGRVLGLYATTASTGDNASGVYGLASGATGRTYGVYGQTDSITDHASGVCGIAHAEVGAGATYGAYGRTRSTGNDSAGVYGEDTSHRNPNQRTFGVYGLTNSAGGFGGYFNSLLVGEDSQVASAGDYIAEFKGSVHMSNSLYVEDEAQFKQDVFVDGTLSTSDIIANNIDASGTITMGAPSAPRGGKLVYSDIAEDIGVANAEAKDVVVIDSNNDRQVTKSSIPYQMVAGVISENPVLHIGKTEGWKPLALAGQVRCKATCENGPIKRGDLLVSSSKPGCAMKGDPDKIKVGMLVGQALQELKSGDGEVIILVK